MISRFWGSRIGRNRKGKEERKNEKEKEKKESWTRNRKRKKMERRKWLMDPKLLGSEKIYIELNGARMNTLA